MTIKTLSLITATLLLHTPSYADTTLEEITVVSTNKTPTSLTHTTANVSVITQEDIQEHGYQTVAQAIASISGISVAHSGGIGQQTSFYVRGQDSGNVLVLLDGMRLNDPSTTNGTALLDSLTTENIAQIEIVKGASGSIWGSNASAGVINIITKTPKEGVHGTLGLTYGSYTTIGADLHVGYKGEKLTAQLLASTLDTESFSALSPRDAESDAYNNQNINLKLGYTFDDNNRLNINYNAIETETDYDDTYSMDGANDDYSNATSQQQNVALDYIYTRGNYIATLHASQGEYERDYYTTGLYGNAHNVYEATLKEYSMINAYDYTTGKAILGLEYKNIDGFNQYNDFAASESDYNNKAVYLSNTYNLTKTTLLETNLRYDNYDAFDNKTSYKVGIKHTFEALNEFSILANYYTSYDAPSAYQLANASFGTLLQPSYTKGYDVSLTLSDLFSLTYFYNTVEDEIDYDSAAFGYYNVLGSSEFSGIEVEASHTFSALNLVTSANYTHLFKYEKEDGSDLLRRPKETLNASLNYYTQSDTFFGIDVLYVGERFDSDRGFPVAQNVSTGNYSVWNLNFGMNLVEDVKLTVNAKNIFAKSYQSVYGYATAGRSAYAKVSYTF
jgi:vitamin B12 transporter